MIYWTSDDHDTTHDKADRIGWRMIRDRLRDERSALIGVITRAPYRQHVIDPIDPRRI